MSVQPLSNYRLKTFVESATHWLASKSRVTAIRPIWPLVQGDNHHE
jgi:hypothetical protein